MHVSKHILCYIHYIIIRIFTHADTGQLCVDVQVLPQCRPSLALPFPISVPFNGQMVMLGRLMIDIGGIFTPPCVRVQLALPTCPAPQAG